MREGLLKAVAVWVLLAGVAAAADKPVAAVLEGGLPGERAGLADAVEDELVRAGYGVTAIDAATLCDSERLTAERFDLLVLPNAASLPVRATASIESYLRAGGDILALNAPLWQQALVRADGTWTERSQYFEAHAGDLPDHVLFRFDADDLGAWTRTTDRPANPAHHESVEESPVPGSRALHVTVEELTGWDTYASPELEVPFPEGHTLTVFAARGGPRTTELSFEWRERDGSRWIAVVPLGRDWRLYVLGPEAFRFWESVPARRNDRFRPENAVQAAIGLAFSHTKVGDKDHEYWVGPVGTAPRTPDYEELLATLKTPVLDTLSPSFKLFDCSDVASLRTRGDQLVLDTTSFNVPEIIRSPHPRPRGCGFDKGQQWRWMPLVEAQTSRGDWRGAPVTLLVHADGPFKGGQWASFGVDDPDWYRTPEALASIRAVAERMCHGVYILDGGSNFYTYSEDQPMRLGLRVMNVGPAKHDGLTARVSLIDPTTSETVVTQEWPVGLEPGDVVSVGTTREKMVTVPIFSVVAELVEDGEVIDRVKHEVHVWRPNEPKRFVTVENGEFMIEGQRWRAHGVNYMPSSGIATDDQDYFEHWVGARSYDPEVIDRDLRHCVDLGLNAVSIFIHYPSIDSQNLLDLLRRLDELGMKANLSLRPGTPMDFEWDKMSALIKRYRIAEQDAVFALDLAWEPMWLSHKERIRWDGHWEQWIVERYGSIETAEKDWGVPVPRDENGAVTNPVVPQTDKDGEWRVMVAAYRRFLDTLLYDKYSAARALVRTLDPNHLVSFRMTEAGNPTNRWPGHLPYDFPYLAGAVDILEPEAYGRIGDWEKVKPGWFEHEYARWAGPDLPCMWAEAGVSAWTSRPDSVRDERLAFQAEYYGHFYRMLASSCADGIFWWWYPGGFRFNEDSDYGIINPDGSDRAVTKVIREQASQFLEGPSVKPVDHWLKFDRDRHPDGIAGVYDAVKDEFWGAIDAGKTPGLRTPGNGTDSTNCPALAVGNTPWTGSNPPKYLDGFFDRVEVRNAAGDWEPVERGGSVRVNGDAPVEARVGVTNLAEATWVAGRVVIRADGAGALQTPLPSAVVRHESLEVGPVGLSQAGLEEPVEVSLTFEAIGRTRFGPRFQIALVP